MQRPRVSVLTSFLNAERFLAEAVDSLFAQSFTAWELLLIDDGSTDGSTALARRYADEWPGKVRCLEHPGHENRGISASQNLGLRTATAPYVAFLDSDDVWFRSKLEEQVALLDAQPAAAMVYGHTNYWYSWTGAPEDEHRDLLIPAGVAPALVPPPTLLTRFVRQEIPIPCPSDVIVRREWALEVGGFEERFRRIFTDQAFYAKVCLQWPVYVADKAWFKYRKHPHSAVAVVKAKGELLTARLDYLTWLSRYARQHGASHDVRRTIRHARWKTAYPRLWNFAAGTVVPAATAFKRAATRRDE